MRLIDAEPLEELLRSRCAQYSDDYGSLAGTISGCLKLVQAQPTIAPPPNDPLTLEELREMDGDPVWITQEGGEDCWTLIRYCNFCGIGTCGCGFLSFDNYSITWLAYRRRPEEGS